MCVLNDRQGKEKKGEKEQGAFQALNFLTCSPPANSHCTEAEQCKDKPSGLL